MLAVHKTSTSISEAERQERIDLAACHRLAVHFGLNEGIDNHFTVLAPGAAGEFLLAPFGLHWSEVKASDFMVINFGGRVVRGDGAVEDSALCIHLPIHRDCPHARVVLHTHMPYATALGMLDDPHIVMSGQSALMFHDRVAYYDYNGLAFDQREGEHMAEALGDKSVMILRNHGVLVVGETLGQAFERLYFLERVAQLQLLAMSTGRPLRPIPGAVMQRTVEQYAGGTTVGGRERTQLHFDALKRLLDRTAPDYAH